MYEFVETKIQEKPGKEGCTYGHSLQLKEVSNWKIHVQVIAELRREDTRGI